MRKTNRKRPLAGDGVEIAYTRSCRSVIETVRRCQQLETRSLARRPRVSRFHFGNYGSEASPSVRGRTYKLHKLPDCRKRERRFFVPSATVAPTSPAWAQNREGRKCPHSATLDMPASQE